MLTLRDPLCELPADAGAYEIAESRFEPARRCPPAPCGSARWCFAARLADAIVRDGAMIISLKVEVLEDGVPGQMVRVRNPQSRRELRGKVLDEQTIVISL